MTHDELVARLTAAIDYDPNPHTAEQARRVALGLEVYLPIVDGNAAEPEEPTAAKVLARLVLARARYESAQVAAPTAPADDYRDRYDRWLAARDRSAADLDRAVSALVRMILSRCQRYPNAATDARGRPISPELRGQPVDGNVRRLDPDASFSAGISPQSTAHSHVGSLVRVARSLRGRFDSRTTIDDSVIEAVQSCAASYDRAHQTLEPTRRVALYQPDGLRASSDELQAATRAAEQFCEYLDTP